jgi:hypothetical protein
MPAQKIYVSGPMFLGGPLHATSASAVSGPTYASTRTIGVGDIHRSTVKTKPVDPRQYRATVTDFYRRMPPEAPTPIEGSNLLYVGWHHYVHASLTNAMAREYI